MFEQDRVLLRLQQRVLSEENILVCFLSGSYGRGMQDAYSDLDVALVFADKKARSTAYEHRREFVRSVLPYLPAYSFDAAHVRPYFHITLYSNGAKVDYRYETLDSLKPTVWDREIRLLKDSGGWGQEFVRAAQQLSSLQPTATTSAAEMAILDERFWIMFMDVYRQVLRGDYDKPFPVYLELLSFALPEILALLPVEEPARDALIGATYLHDTDATIKHLRDLITAYRTARAAVIRRHRLDYEPNSTLERELLKKIIL